MFAEQYHVELPEKPVVDRTDFAIWCISRDDLLHNVADLEAKKGHWELASSTNKLVQPDRYHPTAIARRRAPAPLRHWLTKYDRKYKGLSRLYHGIGRDYPGATMLRRDKCFVTAYDPFHPNPKFRAKPELHFFHEVFSIYTLNVVPKNDGIDLLLEFSDYLRPGGWAVIAVRRDLP